MINLSYMPFYFLSKIQRHKKDMRVIYHNLVIPTIDFLNHYSHVEPVYAVVMQIATTTYTFV